MTDLSKQLVIFCNKYLWLGGFVFLFSLGQLQRIQLTSTFAIYGHEIFALSWIMKDLRKYFSWLKYQFLSKNFFYKSNYILYLFFYIFCQVVLYNIFSFQSLQIAYYLRSIFYGFLLLFLFFQHQTKLLSTFSFRLSTAYIGVFTAALGLLQYLIIPDVRFLLFSGWDDHYYRLISTFFDPGFTSIILVMCFLAIFSWQKKFSNFFFYFISPLFLISILLTYSRAGYFSLIFGLFTFFTLQFKSDKRNWKKIPSFVFIVMFMMLIPFLPKPGGEGVNLLRTASIDQRLESNYIAIQKLNWRTLTLGSSFYRSLEVSDSMPNHATAPDNSFVFLFSSLGIVGSSLLLVAVYQYRKQILSKPSLVVVSSALLTNSIFNNSLFYVWNWVILGIITAGDE